MSKLIKSYNQLPPNVKQSINNVAAKAATVAVKQVQNQINRNKRSRDRARTTRTRNGMRIYTPSDVVENKAIAPVSYATTWTSGNKSLRVHQTEVICKIDANKTTFPSFHDNYSVATFPINPASTRTFPWLSYIARLYDKYRFHNLKFIYVNAVSTQTEGNLMMSLDYDTLDAAPKKLAEASQLAKYKLAPLYCPAEFVIPVSHPGNNNWLYTYDLNVTAKSVDLKTYNLGNFFLSLDGVPQDGKTYGYLAVEYDVELLDKNPAIDVFASKTWDNAAAPAKKARSNVDPADTMSVTITWTHPDEASETNTCTVVFSDDVPVGSKIRLGVNLLAELTNSEESSQTAYLVFEQHTLTEGVQVLDGYSPTARALPSSTVGVMGYWNLDIVLPENRTIQFDLRSSNYTKVKFNDSGDYNHYAIAYTYA